MIKLEKVLLKDKELLYTFHQYMMYEMSAFYEDDMDEDGHFSYGYFEEYFKDKNRSAYFIVNDNIKIGFVMLHNYSYFNEKIDYNMAEFTIFPAYRGKHLAKDTVLEIFKTHIGKWEIKYNIKNIKAKNMWTELSKKYKPIIKVFDVDQEVLCFSNEEER